MAWSGGWGPYVSVAERRAKAAREMEKLRKQGHAVSPVTISGRLIATTFWGKAWCANLESYHDYANRLPRGRTYVRNGSVADLQIASGKATAKVSGSRMYTVGIDVRPVPNAQWQALCRDCVGGIDSLVELLQGRLSKGVMERICRPGDGLFPKPAEITLRCSCPDWATMCKHIAAALYGIGSRLDQNPELLFLLRGAEVNDLVAGLETAGMPLSKAGPAAGKVLESDDMSALFGLDMAPDEAPSDIPVAPSPKPAAKAVRPATAKPVAPTWIPPGGKSRATATTKPPTPATAAPAVAMAPVAKRPPATAKTKAALKAKLLRALGDRVSPSPVAATTGPTPATAGAMPKKAARAKASAKHAPVRLPDPPVASRAPATRTSRRKSPA